MPEISIIRIVQFIVFTLIQFFVFYSIVIYSKNIRVRKNIIRITATIFIVINLRWIYILFFGGNEPEINPIIKYLVFYVFYWWMTAFFFYFILFLLVKTVLYFLKFLALLSAYIFKKRIKRVISRENPISFYSTVVPLILIFFILGTGIFISNEKITIFEKNFHFKKLPESFDGFRIIHLSDFHSDIFTEKDIFRKVINISNSLTPDIVLLTGDYISNSLEFLPSIVFELKNLKSRYGVYATLGNHDYWTAPDSIASAIESVGIKVLSNSSVKIEKNNDYIYVAGIEDLSANPDISKAMENTERDKFTILLSHNPNIFPTAVEYDIPLTLSGHTHGGQVLFKISGKNISISNIVTDYVIGEYRKQNSIIYVNRGIGFTGPPVRINAPPEITLIKLFRKN